MKKVTMKAQHLPSVFINEEKFMTRGMTRWGEFDDLYHISGDTLESTEEQPDLEQSYPCYESHTPRSRKEQELNCAILPRTSSDAAAVRRRTKLPTITRTEVETHRFSINGHFYNHETSVFTPAFGSETKIRINSQMRSRQVIEQLLRKFKVTVSEVRSVAMDVLQVGSSRKKSSGYSFRRVLRQSKFCLLEEEHKWRELTPKRISVNSVIQPPVLKGHGEEEEWRKANVIPVFQKGRTGQQAVLPFSQTWTGWRGTQRSPTKASVGSDSSGRTTPCTHASEGLTCWEGAL